MANKRDSSGQKRARQNRAQRAALQARTSGQAPARPSRVAPATADRLKQRTTEAASPGSGSDKGSGSGAKSASKGSGKREKRQRPPRPGDTPVDIDTLEGSWISKVMHVPGGTQAVFAGAMAIVATGLVSFTKVFVSEADQAELGRKAKASQTIFQAYDTPKAVLLVVVPLAITALAIWFSLHPQRRRIWLAAAVVLGLVSTTGLLQFYLFVAGFFAYAVFRASKVEGRNQPLLQVLLDRYRSRRSGSSDADDADVDDLVDEVDDADDVDEDEPRSVGTVTADVRTEASDGDADPADD